MENSDSIFFDHQLTEICQVTGVVVERKEMYTTAFEYFLPQFLLVFGLFYFGPSNICEFSSKLMRQNLMSEI